jgi:adenine phosphoribosyltransferase
MINAEEVALYPITKAQDEWLKSVIRDVPDFPKPGILFKDITTLIGDPQALTFVVDVLAEKCRQLKPDKIAGIEARGFLAAAPIAYKLGVGLVPIRKPGKLPYKSEKLSYDLEYGVDSIEIHVDAVAKGERVVILDDLLATGGTALASWNLLSKLGAKVVGAGFIIALDFLEGRKRLPAELDVFSLLHY